MRAATTILAAVLAATLMTGCGQDDPEPIELARQACGGVGTDGQHLTPDPESTGIDADDAASLVDETDRRADLAASAAVRDPRWNRLADALSWLATEVEDVRSRSAATGSAAATDEPETFAQTLAAIESECRKANAA
ncbi:hypothetical protein [Streptomyces sp. NPDC101115]|uniref:hypothetical protein n=1 Tax=Streptomyces sp. NPDC101115 TaxID=3366106 RepID=UPI0038044632